MHSPDEKHDCDFIHAISMRISKFYHPPTTNPYYTHSYLVSSCDCFHYIKILQGQASKPEFGSFNNFMQTAVILLFFAYEIMNQTRK